MRELSTIHTESTKMGWHIFWSVILTYIAFTIITAVLTAIVGGITSTAFAYSLLTGSVGQFLDACVVFSIVVLYRDVRVSIVQSIRFSALRQPSTYFYITLGFGCLYIISFLMIEFWQFETTAANPVNMQRHTAGGWQEVFWLIALIIVGPVKEEVMFRGFLYRVVANRLYPVAGLFGSSVLFGIMHPGYPVSSVLAGVVFGLLYQRTNSLAAPILLHMSWNAYVIFST
ncbi:CPBP family intramembrane glutamic endopeptidase [Aneurinibacillus soli]|uniref:CPBP family intramembrane glutamic endopeptidase n=1 Tax=Aneurinibacillus soli TaxID=1500254 RepID=UPI0012FD1542|nr:type II CAAX endopeptidase family protein [Aneurinibacillus soli]